MSYASVSSKLKTILETLKGTGKPLSNVYDYFEPSPQQYPVAMIKAIGGSETRLDSASNFLDMRFIVKVLLRVKNTTTQEALRLSTLDAILDAFRASSYVDTLGGTVEKFDVLSITPFDSGSSDQPIIGYDIIVSASKIKLLT